MQPGHIIGSCEWRLWNALAPAGPIGAFLLRDDFLVELTLLWAAISIGRDVLRPDLNMLVELLMRIQCGSVLLSCGCYFLTYL
jgi:hypothetical protein